MFGYCINHGPAIREDGSVFLGFFKARKLHASTSHGIASTDSGKKDCVIDAVLIKVCKIVVHVSLLMQADLKRAFFGVKPKLHNGEKNASR